jgi:dUTP pyrophosphatase
MATVTLRVVKLRPDAICPAYSYPGDAGLDLFSAEEVNIGAGDAALVPTGIAIELPPCTEAQVRPRSGLALKERITVLNTPGTIDEGYRGEVGVILINHHRKPFLVTKGMKVAQLVIKPTLRVVVEETNTLSDTKRGTGGFGSSGT